MGKNQLCCPKPHLALLPTAKRGELKCGEDRSLSRTCHKHLLTFPQLQSANQRSAHANTFAEKNAFGPAERERSSLLTAPHSGYSLPNKPQVAEHPDKLITIGLTAWKSASAAFTCFSGFIQLFAGMPNLCICRFPAK
ncbi:hypothetical protein CEXT_715221 [Caerostris extrusa]|uniref:Uncharacterized protein n=1 Tax=Caerostris extrusa TaxID=172846 RepID=A0AAV4WX81_CAEEX|nr:hypothetical protein CEXT_715221 [Caerostris extrusa]